MSVEQEINNADARFAEAFNRGDTAALVDEHTADVWVLPFDSPVKRGSDAVESDFRALLDAGWKNLSLGSVEIGSEGNLAYNVGKFWVDIPTKEGTSKRVTGKYCDVYKRQMDGSWKVHVTSFNTDEPLPE